MTDKQCKGSSKACGLRGGRELTTTQVSKQVNTGRSWLRDWTGEVPARVSSYLGGERNGIATPRQVGARNDKGAWWCNNEAARKLEKRPANAGLFIVFGADGQDDYFYPRGVLHRESAGRSWAIRNTSNISGVE